MTPKAGYWIGGGLLAFGLVGALAWGLIAYWHADGVIDKFERVPVPGTATMRLDARDYVVYVEAPRGAEIVPRVRIRITDPGTHKALALSDYEGRMTTDSFGRSGVAEKTVTVPHAGAYVVHTRGADRGRRYMVALGDSVQGLNDVTVYGTLTIGAIFGVSGSGLLIVTAMRRRRRRRRGVLAH
jgi:hypothetical protein